MNKQTVIAGQQIVEERVQLVLEKLALNKMLGYYKYDILMELEYLLALMRRYGVRDMKTLEVLLNMEQMKG